MTPRNDTFRAWIVRRLYRAMTGSTGTRGYKMAEGSRLTSGWSAINSSADQELNNSLSKMRGRSRELVRNSSYAKRAKVIVVNNVVGSGMGMQAQVETTRGELNVRVNDAIESEFDYWSRAENCHTGGKLHFADLERACMGQIFDAGEIILRKRYGAFGASRVPFALEVIEPERLADEWTVPGPIDANHDVRMGVEIDVYQRPVAYWIRMRHPGDVRTNLMVNDYFERVPADQIFHLYVVDRWPQARGEPWIHAAARRLNDMEGYSEAEIVAARGGANYLAFRKNASAEPSLPDAVVGSQRLNELEPGMIGDLYPDEDIIFNNPNRPNPAMDPFMRMMLREVAAGVGVSYESLSRDYSQSNYSSSRLSLLDDRDLWRQLQLWWVRSFRAPMHREWLQAAVLGGAIPSIGIESYALGREKFEAVKFKPRGWSWVDPSKDVSSSLEAVRSGFTTVSAVISQTGEGKDLEDVIKERKRELEMMSAAGILTDSEVAAPAPTAPRPGGTKDPALGTPEATSKKVVPIREQA